MPLVPPTPRRERILVFSGDKVGKTNCWLSIAEKTDVDFWVADGDKAYWQNVEEFDIDHSRMHIYDQMESWTDFVKFAEDALKHAKPDDWIVVDRVDHLREAAINYWIYEVHGKELDAWILTTDKELEKRNQQRAKEGKGEVGLDTEIDYRSINPYYYQYLNKLNIRAKGQHLFYCASARELVTDGGWKERNKAIIDKFSTVGMKPQGGSGFTAIPATILYLRQMGKERFVTTIGDRGRERKHKLERAKFHDFVISYLIPVAKWKFESISVESGSNGENVTEGKKVT